MMAADVASGSSAQQQLTAACVAQAPLELQG